MSIVQLTPRFCALSLFFQCFPGTGLHWEDVIVAHDFGLLEAGELLAWLGAGGQERPATQGWLAAKQNDPGFEAALWAGCKEVLGLVPRPGMTLWEAGQDRWRVALLTGALRRSESPEALGRAVQDVYDRLGCPEDMYGLWCNDQVPVADKRKVGSFLKKLENRLSAKRFLPIPMAG